MAAIVKFVVKSAVAGSLILVTLRVTHGPWQGPHMARLREGGNFMDQPPINSNQEVFRKIHQCPPPPSPYTGWVQGKAFPEIMVSRGMLYNCITHYSVTQGNNIVTLW